MVVSTKQVDAPTFTSVVATSELKTHLRITHSDDDTYIGVLRDAACEFVEDYTNRSITTPRTFEFNVDQFRGTIELPIGPLSSVTSISYKKSKSATDTFLAGADFYVDLERTPAVLRFPNPPTADPQAISPIRIVAEVGADRVPAKVKQAIFLLVAHWYENRQSVVTGTIATEVPLGIHSLLNPHRIISMA